MPTESLPSKSPLALVPPVAAFDHAGTWVLLWSHSQNAVHIEPLDEMLRKNRSAYSDDRRADYVPLVVADRGLVDSVAESIRGTMRLREKQRSDGFLQ